MAQAENKAVTMQLAAMSHRIRMLETAVTVLLDVQERKLAGDLAVVRAKRNELRKRKV